MYESGFEVIYIHYIFLFKENRDNTGQVIVVGMVSEL